MGSIEEKIQPWALACLDGALMAWQWHQWSLDAIFKSVPLSMIRHNLEYILLSNLHKFLNLELLGHSKNSEGSALQTKEDIEDEGLLEKEDGLAELGLQEEIERLAEEDPDTLALTQACSFRNQYDEPNGY
ncbi:hypothetical protein JVU11DRAFT_12718 [Chiua virens]|nr:hypothetical protein JVU11DRAFT_12718 [Chiua virens]